jgi:hypothetical protein
MCEECEENDTLREVYLARRARMARTWTPRRPWIATAAEPAAATTRPDHSAPAQVAAE